MSITSRAIRLSLPFLERHPSWKSLAKNIDLSATRATHSIAAIFPEVIKPQPRQISIAVTAQCNLRCMGCRYGRDFMTGEQLSLVEVKSALDDAVATGVSKVRYYGGEPLLHLALGKMIEHANKLGMYSYVTSNGILLKQKVDELYAAGLRLITIGFYGFNVENVPYAQRSTYRESLERSLSFVRCRYGSELNLQLNFIAMGPTCRAQIWREAWGLAKRFDMYFHVDLISYSTPFFLGGLESGLGLTAKDRPVLDEMVSDFLEYKDSDERRLLHSREFIRSIPDWLLKGPQMKVPCDAYQHLWIGADGTVQLCDTAFKLGSLKEKSLREIMFSEAHRRASTDAYKLNCPNCMCHAETRIQKHALSARKYGATNHG